jgi:hypothetical protein
MSMQQYRIPGIAMLVLSLVACGGGGGGGTNLPGTPAASPTPAPVTSSTPVTQSLAVSAGGITGSLLVNAGGASVSATASTSAPSSGTITPLGLRRRLTLATGTALIYVTITANQPASISTISGAFTLASAPAQAVYLGYWTGSEWDSVSDTPATISGTAATFASVTLSPAILLNPNAYFVLYTASSSLPTPAPSASPSTAPSSAPTASASPSASPSATPAANTFVDTACSQTIAASQTGTLTDVASTFFSSIIPNAHTICLSAWDLSSDIDTALEAAARNGASVTVITPYSQNSSNSSDISAIVAAGGHAKYEYTSSHGTATASIAYQSAPFDIHAKMAIVDGVAYLDGHNWFTTDVVTQDGIAGDFSAIQNVLVNLTSPAPSNGTFTTDKQLSLKNESAYLQSVLSSLTSSTNEYDFITESFNPSGDGEYNDDVYDGMCAISALASHPTMHVVVEEYSGYSSAAQTALQSLMLRDPNAIVRTNNNGHEKISMIRSTVGGTPSSAWFGSSNATTTDLFDWGYDITDNSSGMLTALASYFDTVEWANASAIPTPAPGTTPAPCASPHA